MATQGVSDGTVPRAPNSQNFCDPFDGKPRARRRRGSPERGWQRKESRTAPSREPQIPKTSVTLSTASPARGGDGEVQSEDGNARSLGPQRPASPKFPKLL